MNKIIITILLFLNITHYSFQYICDEKFKEFLTELKPVIESFHENDNIKDLLEQFLESNPKYEELMKNELFSLLLEKLIEIFYKYPNNTIRQSVFAEEILSFCGRSPINMHNQPNKLNSRAHPIYNGFCKFIAELFGLGEDSCE
jgi:hypothetical protein